MLPGLISRFSRFSRSGSHPVYQAEFCRVGDFLSHYFSNTYREINFVQTYGNITKIVHVFDKRLKFSSKAGQAFINIY